MLKKEDSCLMITTKCNWDCNYCINGTNAQKDIPFEVLKERIHDVPNSTVCSLSGGEPGLAPKETIDFLIKELLKKDCDICVNTNGVFLRKFPEYYPIMEDYFYHCSENLDLDEDIREGIVDPDNKILYMIVVTDENIVRLEAFLDKYSDIQFCVHAAQQPNTILPNRKKLSRKNALYIAKTFKHRIHPDHFKYLLFAYSDLNPMSVIKTIEIQ